MKSRVLVAAIAWAVFISALHVHLNVGWSRAFSALRGRRELIVGFLPVT